MILYYGEKTTARKAAKAVVFHYGASAQVHDLKDMGIERSRLSEKERTKVDEEIGTQLERMIKFLGI